MRFKNFPWPLPVFILLFILSGCEEQASGPEIEWLPGVTTTFSYSGGVRTGANFYVKFNVVGDEAGELGMDARLGSTEKSCSAFVEPGAQYSVVARCTIKEKDANSKIILEPSSASKSTEISVSGYSVSLDEVSMHQ